MLGQFEDKSEVKTDALIHHSDNAAVQDNSVVIRRGEPRDKEPVRYLVRQFHEQSAFADMSFSDERFDRHAEAILKKTNSHV